MNLTAINLTSLDILVIFFGVFGAGAIGFMAGLAHCHEKITKFQVRCHEKDATILKLSESIERLDSLHRTAAMVRSAMDICDVHRTAEKAVEMEKQNSIRKCACGRKFELGLMCNYCAIDRESPGWKAAFQEEIGIRDSAFCALAGLEPVTPSVTPSKPNNGEQPQTEHGQSQPHNHLNGMPLQTAKDASEQP